MTSFSDLRRLGVRVLAPVALVTAVLVACGGGTSQVIAFKPTRLLVLGDESSVLVNDGSNDGFKYGLNDRRGTTAGKCLALGTVAQRVAALYGFVSSECNPLAVEPKAFIRALPGAKVADLTAQLPGATGPLGASDLVTVQIGVNDVISAYEQVKAGTLTADAAVGVVRGSGGLLATHINSILGTGARALVITIPDMSLSPYAINAFKTDPSAFALLRTLSYEFNANMRTRIDGTSFDGRNYALVLADDIVAAMSKSPASFLQAPANATVAVCTTASALDCRITDAPATTSLVTGAGVATHLWASDRILGPEAQSRIGQQAQSRAVNNPF